MEPREAGGFAAISDFLVSVDGVGWGGYCTLAVLFAVIRCKVLCGRTCRDVCHRCYLQYFKLV